jgi:bacterioferritin
MLMASEKMLELLNKAIARELQVAVQYMWQHVMVIGLHSESIGGVFRSTAIAEMKHAEAIAERLDYLGGVPTTKPAPIQAGGTVEEMLAKDVTAEEEAIAMYREIIALAASEKDPVTRLLFEKIMSDEEDHHNTFTTLLGK